MKKLIYAIIVAVALCAGSGTVQASPLEAGASASLEAPEATSAARETLAKLKKKEAIRTVLERRGSPLLLSIDDFIKACDKYALDCYLLPSITGLESSFGVHIAPGSYNPFGWGGGYITFDNWGEAIDTVGAGLRYNYIDKGGTSIEAIGATYAASPTWAARVRMFIAEFEAAESKSPINLEGHEIQL